MAARSDTAIEHEAQELPYQDACRIAERARNAHPDIIVVIWLKAVCQTTTAALARLVALRRELRRVGTDLRLVGLTGRAEALFEINRMNHLLPRQSAWQTELDQSRMNVRP